MIKFILYLIFLISALMLIIPFINTRIIYLYKNYVYYINILLFMLSLCLWFCFSQLSIMSYELTIFIFNSNYSYDLYLDSLSLFFIILTIFLTTIVLVLGTMNVKYRLKEYLFYFFLLQFLILNFFLVRNLFFFYIFFEAVLIPMFLIIIIWGSRKRKIHASFVFFFFTFIGSLFMLLGILWFLITFNVLDMLFLQYNIVLNLGTQKILWLLFFVAFAVKVPIFPFHTWLPEAHVEAPTGGSIMLAGILLKLGLYGIIRFLTFIFPMGCIFFSPLVWTISFISVIYISLIIMQQIDLKKIVAYSSIAHMNFAILGIFVFNTYGLQGAIFTMLSHGLISSMLFFCIGILYDRYGERNLLYYSNIVQIMPQFSLVFFFAMVANMGIPGMSSFIGEFLLLLSFSYKSYLFMIILSLSLFLTTIYCIWLYNRISFGFMKNKFITKYKDLTRMELYISWIFIISILIFGIYPDSILDLTKTIEDVTVHIPIDKSKYLMIWEVIYDIFLGISKLIDEDKMCYFGDPEDFENFKKSEAFENFNK